MLTIFAVPKAFEGEFALIQRNAIRSWASLHPVCEILLLGDDPGTREMAAEVGAISVPGIVRSEAGTPLLNSMFAEAEKYASFPILCYVNSDIILFDDFLIAVAELLRQNSTFLAVGQRTNLEVPTALDFSSDWQEKLRERVSVEGVLEPPNGLDYFVFPRSLWGDIPPFALGRMAWDQWFLYRARSRGIPVVDCTDRIRVIHQKHGYGHHPGAKEGVCNGPEAQRNLKLAGGYRQGYTLRDATHKLTKRGVKVRLLPYDLRRCLVMPITNHRLIRPLIKLARTAVQGSAS